MEDRVRKHQGADQLELFAPERNNRRAFRVAIIAVVLAIGAVIFVPFAFAQEQGVGLICNQASEIEAYLAEKGDTATRVKAVNEKAGETACGIIPVYYIRDTEVIKANDGIKQYDIVKITIIAVHNGQAWVTVPPMEQYTLFQSSETPV